MLPLDALCSMYPLIVTPTHDGKLFGNYVLSLLRFQTEAQQLGMPLCVEIPQGESLITRARNNAAANFLENRQWTHLFWIDSDIGFTPEAALRLLRSDYDVAAGAYPLKRELWPKEGLAQGMTREEFLAHHMQYPLNLVVCPDTEAYVLEIQPDGFFQVEEAATGFMVIKRQALEAMVEHYPELAYEELGFSDNISTTWRYCFFDARIDPRTSRYMSEDYAFCQLWRAMGGTIHMDGKSNLSHQGLKLYEGNYANSLLRAPDLALPRKAGTALEIRGIEHLYPDG
ncbi:hypothetical protein FA378_31125 [Pseudomonas aeruginosa]|uniref:hypothetical protein n=1 Tax=Pseudomonas aeruginosa TaxID=287 RepID=UPI003D2E077E|nr:hypothetical protein [Pseudomonas aeruginosa]MCO2762790.1 hypothetical protein [Pseudomonas aeruginosa]MCO2768925.1 hypothetical protein [Pseudomonas aeruginosa]HBO5144364.1 hypothetical protein [Pseudomonas aeruginosa]